MPRTALALLVLGGAWAALAPSASGSAGSDPHVDPGIVLDGCGACHRGHGEPQSPMLPAPQKAVCLACHDTLAAVGARIAGGALAAGASPPLLGTALAGPYPHPLSDQAHTSDERGAVTCSSCHSPHRSMPAATDGDRKLSPRDPTRFEFELCLGCHGYSGAGAPTAVDLGRLVSPMSRSYHPIEAPARDASPSVAPGLAGGEINCTDCHGSDDRSAARGPHGSSVPFILARSYSATSGAQESAATYALCYQCHDRQAILERSAFPEHGEHIVDLKASCSTCHNPHGSEDNRALIRFGERGYLGGEVGLGQAGRIAFVSSAPGSGACFLSCHGEDHNPKSYGGEIGGDASANPAALALPPAPAAARTPPEWPLRERLARPRPPRRPQP